jgi:eukaryotic-like serine/threonine-protein kinase
MSEVRFGEYRITGTLGSGALSTIYKAVQEPLGRVVALKALKSQIAPTSSFGEQLEREAKILADLVHPHVVMLLGASRIASGRPYIVLEFVDGPTLDQLLTTPRSTERGASRPPVTKKKKLSVPAALAIACGICSALEHIHGRGVVHRDVKPSNVLFTRFGVVKMIDFGIAQRPRLPSMSDALGTEGITATGKMAPEQIKDAFGTPAYMSPEQILGDFVDGRSDLFSLGVVLYQMLSGWRPFDGADGDDGKRSAAQRIRRDAPPPLRERAPHCPRAVERIVMRLLEKSPNDRYPSAGIVKERLEAALRAETREDPAAIIRGALIDAGFGDALKEGSGPRERRATENRPRPAASTTRTSISLSRALLGFVAIAVAFVAFVIMIEGTSAQARETRNAGARALELAPNHAGGLRVVATPWAHVRVDGQLVETTPFARPIPLTAGKHWVSLSHPDAVVPVDREVTIVTGEVMTLDVTMNMGSEDAGKDAAR